MHACQLHRRVTARIPSDRNEHDSDPAGFVSGEQAMPALTMILSLMPRRRLVRVAPRYARERSPLLAGAIGSHRS